MRACDTTAVSALVLLLGLAAPPLIGAAARNDTWWPSIAAALCALFCADLISGVVHWIGDRFFSESTPLLGRMLIRPFREHHRDPLAITHHDLFELCGNNALAVLPPALWLVLAAPPTSRGALLLQLFTLFFSLAILATNLIHKWAHQPRNRRPVCWLQAAGVILSPAAHARHHRDDFSRGYCVTTGWANPLLDAWRVLPRCEAALRRFASGLCSRGSRHRTEPISTNTILAEPERPTAP